MPGDVVSRRSPIPKALRDLSAAEIAERVGRHPQTVRRWRREGHLPERGDGVRRVEIAVHRREAAQRAADERRREREERERAAERRAERARHAAEVRRQLRAQAAEIERAQAAERAAREAARRERARAARRERKEAAERRRERARKGGLATQEKRRERVRQENLLADRDEKLAAADGLHGANPIDREVLSAMIRENDLRWKLFLQNALTNGLTATDARNTWFSPKGRSARPMAA